VDVLDADEFRKIVNERYEDNDVALSLLGDQSTNWQDEIYQDAFGQDHYLSLTGAYKSLPYRVSYGYSAQDGILKTDNMKRHTIGLALTPLLFDDHLKIDFNARAMFIKNRFADRGAIAGAVQFDPTKPITTDSTYTIYYLDPNGDSTTSSTDYGGYYAWTQTENGLPVGQATTNPVALLNMREDISDVNRILGNIQLDYKFHFLPELRANLNLGYDRTKSDGTVYVPDYAAWEFDATFGGGLDRVYDQEKKNELLDFYLNYTKSVDNISSTFDVMAGYSWQHFWQKSSAYETNILGTQVREDINDASENYLVSFFGRLMYTFKNRYLLTFTLRYDGTSRFSEDNRWGTFPALALAWKINEESWLKDVDVVSQLKLRLGYGVTGQQNLNEDFYPYLPRYTYSQGDAKYRLGDSTYTTLRADGYDQNIKWEETTTWNFALDYGFDNDRYYGTIDFYFKETKDLINEIPVPAGSNLTNYITTNIGDLENKGVEFSFITRAISQQDWTWLIGFNATYNENKITKLTASDDPEYLGVPTGDIAGGVGNKIQLHSVGHPASSFFVKEQVYDSDGNPIENMYVDRNGDGEINDEDRYLYKDPAPKFYFGISSSLQYKNWDFSFAGRAQFGNYVFNNVSSENGVYQRLYRSEGPYLSNITKDVTETNFQTTQFLSNYYIQDGSFFRMDNISLSYWFDNLLKSDKDKLSLQLSFTVNNAFVITKYDGIDPEIDDGIDNNLYPRPRVYVLGVNLQF